ncbi:MAG: hypothetical protein PHR36_04975 [Patescibacteria group bacterium]|nr:hypothetical protein [Patescibacteria group bacterium]
MAFPTAVQIGMEFAGILGRLGKNIPFKIKIDPDSGGFCKATCVDQENNPVEGVEPIKFQPNIADPFPNN